MKSTNSAVFDINSPVPANITVNLGERTYDINIIQSHTAEAWRGFVESLQGFSQVVVVSNKTVYPLYQSWWQSLEALCNRPINGLANPVLIDDGEHYKSWQTAEFILAEMLRRRVDRKSVVVAFGGGVVGDMAGFVASIYQRGIAVIQIPTTLLAMVDSSVGGKTGVNHPLGKNMIGAIHQPKSVWIDAHFLGTLPSREVAAGMAEVIKYGLLGDAAFFDFLCESAKSVSSVNAKNALIAEHINKSIAHSIAMKAGIVERDETEQGERALLNLGHTFGHAIESLTHYKHYLHGEAVAIGTMMAASLSQKMGWLTANEVLKIEQVFQANGLPTRWENPPERGGAQVDAVLNAMAHDKKNQFGKLRLILLKKMGQAEIIGDAPIDLVRAAIGDYCGGALG